MAEQKPNLINWFTARLYESEKTANAIRRLAWAIDIPLMDDSWELGICELSSHATAEWLLLARKQFANEKLIDTGFSYRGGPRITLRYWLTKHLSIEIANDFDDLVSQLENHWSVLPKLCSSVGATQTETEVEELRSVFDQWAQQAIRTVLAIRERIKAIHFAMGWHGTPRFFEDYQGTWEGYEGDSLTDHTKKQLSDGLYRADALLVWGDQKYEWLTDTMMDAIDLLVLRYPDHVKPSEMEHKVGKLPEDGFKKIFKINRGGKTSVHPVAKLIGGRAPKGWFLIK
jgi:hypothetical protein